MNDFVGYAETLSLYIVSDGNLSFFAGLIYSQEHYDLVTEADISNTNHWLKEQSIVSKFNLEELVVYGYHSN
jgi:hypothetical protein